MNGSNERNEIKGTNSKNGVYGTNGIIGRNWNNGKEQIGMNETMNGRNIIRMKIIGRDGINLINRINKIDGMNGTLRNKY